MSGSSYADPDPTAEDLAILHRADEILASPSVWNPHAVLSCPEDLEVWSLWCALRRASVEVLGVYDHRRAALQKVRFLIEERNPEVRYAHRLTEFNDAAGFEGVKGLLALAISRLAQQLE